MAATHAKAGAGHVQAAGIAGHGDHAHDEPHLPHGSWWPFWLAMGISLVGVGLIALGRAIKATVVDVHDGVAAARDWALLNPLALAFFLVSLAFLLFTLVGWWREDFKWWKTNTGTGERIPKAGTLLFISSEIFLFGALLSTYFNGRKSAFEAGFGWPDPNLHGHALDLMHVLPKVLIFSLFLFASSGTIHMAEKALLAGNKRKFNQMWLATIILGTIFLAGQVWEYYSLIAEGHTLGSSRYISAFFMLTGTHGAHVLGGLVFLVIVYVRSVKGQFDERRHAAPQCASLYWHFVDIVWIVVLSLVYLWPAFA